MQIHHQYAATSTNSSMLVFSNWFWLTSDYLILVNVRLFYSCKCQTILSGRWKVSVRSSRKEWVKQISNQVWRYAIWISSRKQFPPGLFHYYVHIITTSHISLICCVHTSFIQSIRSLVNWFLHGTQSQPSDAYIRNSLYQLTHIIFVFK